MAGRAMRPVSLATLLLACSHAIVLDLTSDEMHKLLNAEAYGPSQIGAPAFVMVLPKDCGAGCKVLGAIWEDIDRSKQFEGRLFMADCAMAGLADCKQGQTATEKCEEIARSGLLHPSEPLVLEWDGRQWGPYTGPKTQRGLEAMMQASVARYHRPCQQDCKRVDAQLAELARRIEEMRAGKLAVTTSGVIDMLSDQMPVWFYCTSFVLTAAWPFVQDLVPPGMYMVKFPGQAWSLKWTLLSANESSTVLTWRAEHTAGWSDPSPYPFLEVPGGEAHSPAFGAGPAADGVEHRVELVRDNSLHDRGNLRRRCEMPISRRGRRQRSVQLFQDGDKSYDWMRFRYLGWANAVASVVKSRWPDEAELVMLDVGTGSGWLPLLMKARFGSRLHVILTDLSADALSLAQSNFRPNELEATFLVGDMLAPLAADPSLPRPQVVYFYPGPISDSPGPQHGPPRSAVGDDANRRKVYAENARTPAGPGLLHYFEVLAHDLPPFLAEDAVLFLGVTFDLVTEVKALFSAAGWTIDQVRIAHTPRRRSDGAPW